MTVDTINKKNDDNDYVGNVKIYLENKTNETIVVHDKDYFYGVELARISIGKVQRINIRKGKTLYIGGGKTKKRYIDIICDTDNETYSIHYLFKKDNGYGLKQLKNNRTKNQRIMYRQKCFKLLFYIKRHGVNY